MMRRWYWTVGWRSLLVLCAVLATITSMMALAPAWVIDRIHWLVVGLHVVPALVGVTAVWLCWVCPWLEAGDWRAAWPLGRRRHERILRACVWAPVGVLFVCGSLVVLVPLADLGSRGVWVWDRDSWFWILLACIAVLLTPWAWWLNRQVKRRCDATLALRTTCWRCGYDLRGNPDAGACPECGQAIASRPDTGVSSDHSGANK